MAVLFGIIGLFMGSFYMVVGDRWSRDESIMRPRSHCENCKKPLSWYELIPVVSYFFLRGRCRKCKDRISIWYPLTELLTGSLFVSSYVLYGFSLEMVEMIVLSSLLVIIFVSDFKYLVILDIPLLIACALVLLFDLFGSEASLVTFGHSILAGIVLFLFMWLIKFCGDKKFKRESLGGGDVKLAFLIGASVGYSLGFVSLVLGCFLTYPFAFYYMISKKEKEIPFGPFLMMALVIVYIFSGPISQWLRGIVM